METYNIGTITKKIYDSKLCLFTAKTLKDILTIKKENTMFNVIQRLVAGKILSKIERNKYLLKDAPVLDYSLAYFLYQPSYISFETALNVYGVLSQFPYETTSATTKKTIKKTVEGKNFSYFHIKKELFWGYEKKDDYLIASVEKALLDQLYFVSKGLKRADLEEYDMSFVNHVKLKSYLRQYAKAMRSVVIASYLTKYISL